MEDQLKNIINTNLPKLVELTFCSSDFLAIFRSKDLFSSSDVQIIEAEKTKEGRNAASSKFYDLLQTRPCSFETLKEALKLTTQTGAVNILKYAHKNVSVKKTRSRFSSKSPKYLTDYLNEQDERYLIVCTHDCQLTCDRILETTPKCKLFSITDILDAVFEATDESLDNHMVLLSNLENDLGLFDVIDQTSRQKVVFVTQLGEKEVKSKLPQPTSAWKLDLDNIQWIDLSLNEKRRILSSLKQKLGLSGQELTNTLKSIETKVLVDLLNDKFPTTANIFRDTIPQPINYYLKRTLETRNVISNNILDCVVYTEFFLFSGIRRFALSSMCTQTTIELSSNLLRNKKAISPFVYLESEIDFESIVQTFPTNAIHLLEYESDKFIWKKSCGKISSIQKFVASKQRILEESEFVSKVLAETNLSPICISDTPGKGKSILLASLAFEMKKHYKHEIVAYISIKELVQRLRGTQPISDKSIISSISYFLENSALGNLYLEANKHQLRELMLDGFDEIAASDSDFALKSLTEIRKVFSKTRIWITTRPHMLSALENCLETLGYNISPFSRTDQKTFLKSFWSGRIPDCDKEILFDFADKCLKTLEKSLGEKGDEIAGIPLQCLLIGEVFEDDAKRFLKRTILTDNLLSQEVSTIAVLYQKLIDKKWKNFNSRYNTSNLSKSVIFTAHMHLALKHLYPGHLNEFSDKLVHNMSTKEIIDFGLIEAKSILTTCEFLHRTFAEYFVALFVSDILIKSPSDKSFSFLFFNIMKTSIKYPFPYFPENFYRCLTFVQEFTENVICYFVNTFLEGTHLNVTEHVSSFSIPGTIRPAAEACLYHNLENLFFKVVLKHKFRENFLDEELLVKAVYWVDAHFMKIIIEDYLSITGNRPILEVNCNIHDGRGNWCDFGNTDLQCPCTRCTDYSFHYKTLLHVAMIKGEFETVEFLIKNHFRALVETNHGKIYDDLMYALFTETGKNNDLIVAERRQIVHYIANLNKNLLITETYYGLYALEAQHPHIDLVLEIWKLGKHFYAEPNTAMQILKTLSRYLSRDNFYVFIKTAFSDLSTATIEKIIGSADLLENLIDGPGNMDVFNFFEDKFTNFLNVNSNIRIQCFLRAKEECILEWLLNNLSYTSQDIIVLFKFLLRKANPIGLNVLLAHIKNLQNLENLPNFFDIFTFLYREKNPLSVSNCFVIAQLSSYFLWKADLNYFVELDFETTLANLIECGFSLFDKLVCKDFMRKSDECILKVVWLISVYSKFPKDVFVKYLRCNLKDLDVKAINVSGNNLLHLFASSFSRKYDYSPSFLDKIAFSRAFNRMHNKHNNCHRVISQWAWELLVEDELSILQVNLVNQTPICLLSINKDYKSFIDCFGDLILVAVNQMKARCNDNIGKIHKIFYLVIKSQDLKVVKKVYELYNEICKSQNLIIANVTVSFNEKKSNFLDAAIQSGDGDVFEFVNKILQILVPILPPPDCVIHHSIYLGDLRYKATANYIKYLGETFPAEINQLVNEPNDKNLVPLLLAPKRHEIVKVLHDFGANFNATDDSGNTPLHVFLKIDMYTEGMISTIHQFMRCGSHVNAQNLKEETPLSIFVQSAKHRKFRCQWSIELEKNVILCEFLEKLLGYQADPSIPDDNGNNCLHHLVQGIYSGHLFHRVVKILISHNFVHVLESRNFKGQTPIELADKYFKINEQTKQLLRTHGFLYFGV